MLSVTFKDRTNGRTTIEVMNDETISDAFTRADRSFVPNTYSLNGTTISEADLDQTFSDCGVTGDHAVISFVPKGNNA